MSYNPLIPQPADIPAQSQGQMLTNFTVANTAFGVDHTPFDTTFERGFHKWVHLPVTAPAAGAANQGLLYMDQTPGYSSLYWRRDANAPVQMTGPEPVIAQTGRTFLPGGLILAWGNTAVNIVGLSPVIPFIPNFADIYSIVVTPSLGSQDHGWSIYNMTTAGFQIDNNMTGGPINYLWMAIGR